MKLRAKTKNRLRHHSNPLNFRWEQLEVPDWQELLGGHPEVVDIGIGMGEFLCAYAQLHPNKRMVGLEVRQAFCDEARLRLHEAEISNALVVHANATVYLNRVLEKGSIELAFLSFPDPWFKKRHHKRRLISETFLEQLHWVMKPGAEFLLQSDNQELVEFMVETIENSGLFINQVAPHQTQDEPFSEATTEREDYYARKGYPVWRYRYTRQDEKKKQDSP